MNKKLYLDIDGVLLGKARPEDIEIILSKYAPEFLEYCINNYTCYWLTTHSRDKDVSKIVNLMKRYTSGPVLELIQAINPTQWNMLKTEAIDFASDFYWIEDQPLWAEIEVLKKNNAFDRWIKVDTRTQADDLKRVLEYLKSLKTLKV